MLAQALPSAALSSRARTASVPLVATTSARSAAPRTSSSRRLSVVSPRCGNAYENGVFAPIVRVARDVIGVKRFNQIRGKAIALHSQVIGDFCAEFGCDSKVKQRLIRTAKANWGKLGFLA